ncbi:MAG TPA: hypothetical protein VK174_17430 [Chitinophagales bacterium]|nr:hypothetical protein [Chitinophagales bacterium]
MIKKLVVLGVLVAATSLLLLHTSCKSCNKDAKPATTDSVSTAPATPVNSINLPHADTTLIPILGQVLDEAFEASAKKDYAKFATYLLYHGPDERRFGNDTYNTKNATEKKIVSITSDVFNKWNRNVESREYLRVFELPQGDGSAVPVLEVVFVTSKTFNRKFFIFFQREEKYKIMEVSTNLQ